MDSVGSSRTRAPRSSRSAKKFERRSHDAQDGEEHQARRSSGVTERGAAERVVRDLHAARVAGDLAGMCRLFADTGRFEILGASADKPIAIQQTDLAGLTPWRATLVKVFKINNYAVLSTVVEWPRARAHWRADIYSKV